MSVDMCKDPSPSSGRTRRTSISDLMSGLHTHGSGAVNKDQSIGKFFSTLSASSMGICQQVSTDFNTDVLVWQEPVRNDYYYTDLFSLECLHTGYITARYVNRRKYESKYEMINKVFTEYWVYEEHGDGFGTPRNAFFTAEEAVFIRQAGQRIWSGVDQT